jgi:replication-associated recombination protein RarA
MSVNLPRDPWVQVRTYHNLPADEVISALQKEIRRGHLENAGLLAYEMLITSPELEEKLWKRLLVISVEDIGMGSPQAPQLIYTLYQIHQTFDRNALDRPLFALHAVRFLCECKKDRSSDEMLNWMRNSVEKEGLRPEIPDYAIDMHTGRGQKMGRGLPHFFAEGSQIHPELPGRNTQFRERLLKLLEIE